MPKLQERENQCREDMVAVATKWEIGLVVAEEAAVDLVVVVMVEARDGENL